MTPAKYIRIRGAAQVESLLAMIPNLPRDGSFEVVIRPYKKNASAEQRGLLWVRLAEIADQAWVAGKQYNSDTWHVFFKKTFLPEDYTEGITRDHYQKWTEDPRGERNLIGSTEMLTAKGKAEYMTQIEAYATGELGVQFSADPRRYHE